MLSFLDWFGPGPSKHPVFGKVTSGMDIVNKIGVCKTDGTTARSARQDEQDHHRDAREDLSSKRDHDGAALYY